jgi:hypothetical protein
MQAERGSAGAGCIAWLALLLAAVALAVAWLAFQRTGGRLQDLQHVGGEAVAGAAERPLARARDALGLGGLEAERRTALAEAEARLAARRAELQANLGYAAARHEVESVRRDLARTFDNAGTAARLRWQELDGDLARLDQQLRERSSHAVATLDEVISRLRSVLGGGEEGNQDQPGKGGTGGAAGPGADGVKR